MMARRWRHHGAPTLDWTPRTRENISYRLRSHDRRFLLFPMSVAQLGKLRNGHGCRRAQSKRNAGAVLTALVRTRRRHAAATWVAARRNSLIRAQKIEFEIAHRHSAQYDSKTRFAGLHLYVCLRSCSHSMQSGR